MQAVILAAGRGTRMGNFTDIIPKPMLKVLGKNLIEHKLEALPDSVNEVIFVVGYLGDIIKNYFGNYYKGRKITYVTQDKLYGTGHALWQAKDLLTGRFLVMMGDDIYCKTDIERCLEYPWAMLVSESEKEVSSGGRVFLDDKGNVKEVVEGTHTGKNVLISAAMYSLTKEIFKYDLVQLPGKEEWGLPQTIANARKDFPMKAVKGTFWIQITTPADLKQAENILSSIYGNLITQPVVM